jgi:hypothetical protein
MSDIWLNLVFEDVLSETVLRKLLSCSTPSYVVDRARNAGGFGWIKKRIRSLNDAAKGMPYLVLTDLDTSECAPVLIRQWLNAPKHPNLLLRVAVRAVEAWLLGCRESFAAFLGVPESRIPAQVEGIVNPKEYVVNLARRSRKKDIRLDIVPRDGSTAKVGPDYNGRLTSYVLENWDPIVAKEHSPSLQKAMEALDTFEPVFLGPRTRGD